MMSALHGGTTVMAWELDRVARHDMGFTCPVCGEPVVSRCGEEVPWHFAHKPGSDCELVVTPSLRESSESRAHLSAKYHLARAFTAAGYSVAVEEKLGKLRRPDLTVISPGTGRWVTVEIQASPIHTSEMHFRWQHDLEAGATDVLWIWAERLRFNDGENLTLPDDILHYRRTTGVALSIFNRGHMWVASDGPTWWLCENCSESGVELKKSRRPTCPTCDLSRPVFYDDAVRSYDLLAASGRIVVCRGRRGPVARFAALESRTVRDQAAEAL